MWCCFSLSALLQNTFLLCIKIHATERFQTRSFYMCLCLNCTVLHIACSPEQENNHHEQRARVSGHVSICLWIYVYVCVCVHLKLDSSESVPTTKFTSVLTELSGLPSQSGGDRQCISSLSY